MSNGNEPANPSEERDYIAGELSVVACHTGLTKREHFAAMAMTGLVSHDRFCTENVSKMAEWAAECADALLKALDNQQGE